MKNLNLKYHLTIRLVIVMMITAFTIVLGGQLSLSAQFTNDFVTVYPSADTSYFTNPGIGWQRMEGNTPPLLEETVVYGSRSEVSWRVLNPALGEYDWSALEEKIDVATSNGQLFSFRVYTMRGEEWGGHQVPQWVVNRDSSIIQGGSPNYASCSYQTYWAIFVDQLRTRYDGDSRISFIDISGYGNFNEWSWTDGQTVWDDNYINPNSLDGMARIRLADMFIGGGDQSHDCETSNGGTQTTSYNYPGFQSTQLMMPYAGIQQSTRYVADRRSDVGIRYDCLGREGSSFLEKVGDVVEDTWRNAPIIFELCDVSTSDTAAMETSETFINASHAVLVHENMDGDRDEMPVRRLMTDVGYRYQLTQAVYDSSVLAGDDLSISMAWQNVGTSPAYPSMGYDFELQIYLLDSTGTVVTTMTSASTVSWWMPANPFPGQAPVNSLGEMLAIPANIQSGIYELRVGIINVVNGQPITLAIDGADNYGRYLLGQVTVAGDSAPTTQPTATITPTLVQPTDTLPTNTPMATSTQIPTAVPDADVTQEPTTVPDAGTTQEPTTAPDTDGEVPVEPTAIPTLVPPTAIPTTVPPTAVPTLVPPQATAIPPVSNNTVTLHISNLDGQKWNNGDGTWTAYIDILVQSSDNQDVDAVTVSGVWGDGTSFTCVSHWDWCGAELSNIPRSQNSATFTITNLSYPSMTYNPAANSDPQQGRNNNQASNGTSITVTHRNN